MYRPPEGEPLNFEEEIVSGQAFDVDVDDEWGAAK